MLNEAALFFLLGSIVGSYLFSNLFGWLVKFFTSWTYDKRLVFGGIVTIIIGGLVSAFGAGEGGFEARMEVVTKFGFWFIWSQFYGVTSMLGVYFMVKALMRR